MSSKDPVKVEHLFNTVAPSYDMLNDVFSFGLHRIWKSQFLKSLQPSLGEHWIDLCCGTGDLSISLASYLGPEGRILGVDFSKEQIDLAKKRALKKSIGSISWLNADVLQNGLPSASFDGAIMAYGLRNLCCPEEGLTEVRRLLKRGARAGILDFNHTMDGTISSWFQKVYLQNFVVSIASKMGLGEEYSYLEESIKRFPEGFKLKAMALDAGFSEASYKVIAYGQMGILLLQA